MPILSMPQKHITTAYREWRRAMVRGRSFVNVAVYRVVSNTLGAGFSEKYHDTRIFYKPAPLAYIYFYHIHQWQIILFKETQSG